MTEERYLEINQMFVADARGDEIEWSKRSALTTKLQFIPSVHDKLSVELRKSQYLPLHVVLIAVEQGISVSKESVPFGLDFQEYAEYLREWMNRNPLPKFVDVKNLRGIY